MNCFAAIFKYLLYVLNLIFLIIGILLITLGSIMLANIGSFSTFDNYVNMNAIPIIITVVGCVIFLISFIGCCGTMRENACLTTTYAVFMFILFALQLVLTVWIFIKRRQFLDTMGEAVETAWSQNDNANGYPMDALQLALKCCGNEGFEDYVENNVTVPGTCCGYTNRNQECPADIYKTRQGCNQKFVHFWASNTDIIRWSGIGIAIFELVVFTVACCLASSMRKAK